MTNKEIQKTMEVIIHQQESFSEGMEQLRESHAKGEQRLSRLEGAFVNLYNHVTKLGETGAENATAQKELIEAQSRTDDRLNALIDVVERLITKGRNGRGKS